MIELGKKQTLQVVKTVDFGVYLAEDMNADTKHQVLLPAKSRFRWGPKPVINWRFLFIRIHRIE